jgi:3-oxoacyl-[acyl-carrier-protein] synthase II
MPPTVNLGTPDPACDLDYIQGDGRPGDPEFILSNSFGFGGINAALVFKRSA